MTETAISEKLGLSSRDKDFFKSILADLTADDAIRHEKRGKGHYYHLNLERWDEDTEKDDDFVYDLTEWREQDYVASRAV